MTCNFQENYKGEGAGAFKNILEFSRRVVFIIGRRRNAWMLIIVLHGDIMFTWNEAICSKFV